MKTLHLFVAKWTILACILSLSISAIAQDPPHPPGSGHNEGANQPSDSPAASPIGEGLEILIALGILYSIKKTYKLVDNHIGS